jgi:hypothetical protein
MKQIAASFLQVVVSSWNVVCLNDFIPARSVITVVMALYTVYFSVFYEIWFVEVLYYIVYQTKHWLWPVLKAEPDCVYLLSQAVVVWCKRSVSGRVLRVFWCSFFVMIVVFYIANLAAMLVRGYPSNAVLPIPVEVRKVIQRYNF